jgi:hypothetical protein
MDGAGALIDRDGADASDHSFATRGLDCPPRVPHEIEVASRLDVVQANDRTRHASQPLELSFRRDCRFLDVHSPTMTWRDAIGNRGLMACAR